MSKPRRTFRITRHRPDPDRDVQDEIQFHMEMRIRELIQQGLLPRQAEEEAFKAFGNPLKIEADCRQATRSVHRKRRWADAVDSCRRDFSLACRNLLRRPGYSAVALLTIALCLAVNTAVFSVVESILLAPLPFPDSDRILILFNSYPNAGSPRSSNSVPDYYDRQQLEAFQEVALYQSESRPVGKGEAVRNVFSMQVTPSFFAVLQVEPESGRAFLDEEGEVGRDAVAIISHGLSRELFGEAPAVGRTVSVLGASRTIVGVMPPGFLFADWDAQIWLPLAFNQQQKSDAARHRNGYQMIARLKSGVPLETARAQLDALNAAIAEEIPPKLRESLAATGFHTQVHLFKDDLVREVRPSLLLLWAGALFVLLIGCLSLANLQLVRATGRMRELAARLVLGASRWRLTRLLLSESLLLAVLGGGAGLLAAGWSLTLLDAFEVYQIPRIDEVRLGGSSMLAALVLTLGVGLLSSVLPAAIVHRFDLFAAFRGSGRSSSGRSKAAWRGILASLQVAVAFVLMAGAGLMLASLLRVRAVDPGIEADNVLATAIALPYQRYPEIGQRLQFIDQALGEIRALQGVVEAAIASQIPFSGSTSRGVVTPEGKVPVEGESIQTHYGTVISPTYFEALGIPLLEGRVFDSREQPDSPPVVIVDERLAKTYWPESSAVGKRLLLDSQRGESAPWHTVIGVVGEVRQNDLADPSPVGAYYLPHQQVWLGFFRLAVKTSGEPRGLLAPLRRVIAGMDPEIPLFWVQTLQESVNEQLILRRIPLELLAFFAAAALFLAAVAIYGILDEAVRQRTREIGIRMALGSSLKGIHSLVLGKSLRLLGIGQAMGLIAALLLGGWMAGFLYQVRPHDPWVLLLVAVLTSLAALTASWLPTRRAARVNPVQALSAD